MNTKKKQIVINLTSLGVGLLVGFIIVELMLRILYPNLSYDYPKGMFLPDNEIGYKYKPNFDGGYLNKQEFSTRMWTNSKGFRDREHREEKDKNTFRILAIGDSLTWGAYGVEAEETVPALLERKLKRKFPQHKFEVINTGVLGYGTDNELAFYKKEGRKYSAYLVLVNFCVANDFHDNMEWGEYSVLNGNLVSTSRLPERRLSLKYARNIVLEYSYLVRFLEQKVYNIPIIQRLIFALTIGGETHHIYGGILFEALISSRHDQVFDEMFSKTAALLQEFNKLARKEGSEFALVILPADYQVDDRIRDYVSKKYKTGPEDISKAQRRLKQLGLAKGFTVIDLLPQFVQSHREKPLYWKFNPHFTRYGNEVATEVIMTKLVEGGLIRPFAQ